MKISFNSVEIVVVGQDIDGDMDLDAMGMGKLNALLHLVMAEILGLGTKPEGISADINRIGAEGYGCLKVFSLIHSSYNLTESVIPSPTVRMTVFS